MIIASFGYLFCSVVTGFGMAGSAYVMLFVRKHAGVVSWGAVAVFLLSAYLFFLTHQNSPAVLALQ